jgi:hypothetical protein
VLLEELLPRLASVGLNGPVERPDPTSLRIKNLPLKVQWA